MNQTGLFGLLSSIDCEPKVCPVHTYKLKQGRCKQHVIYCELDLNHYVGKLKSFFLKQFFRSSPLIVKVRLLVLSCQ